MHGEITIQPGIESEQEQPPIDQDSGNQIQAEETVRIPAPSDDENQIQAAIIDAPVPPDVGKEDDVDAPVRPDVDKDDDVAPTVAQDQDSTM